MPIRRLPSHLVNQIAAGEVVERPAAALKELIENALDAGARHIAITAGNGGLDHLGVADDGHGMSPPEIRLALERHATSKLPRDRLDEVATLGFRGEALPSIASVARLAITSRPPDATSGWRVTVDHGETTEDGPAAARPGTRVHVDGLFARVPARRKFLRSPRAEWLACLDVARRLAMARPEIGFTLDHDGRRALDAPAQATLAERLAALFGPAFAADLAPVEHVRDGLALHGFAGLPTASHATPAHQYLFVNARPVRDRALGGAVRGAYSDLLARARHPAVALFLTVPAHAVDVNVHPAKTEVRFTDPEGARALIVGGLRRALDAAAGRSAATVAAAALGAFRPPAPARHAIVAEARLAFAAAAAPPRAPAAAHEDTIDRPLGQARAQLHNMWIVAETAQGMILVDQHAAHERVTLARLGRAIANGGAKAQALLLPEVVELDEAAAARLDAAASELAQLGLELERFGPCAVVVRALPALIANANAGRLVRDLADELADLGQAFGLKERLDAAMATIACHASVTAGRALSLAEMDALLRAMEETPHAEQCNHGRPTYVTLAKSDVERLFGRR